MRALEPPGEHAPILVMTSTRNSVGRRCDLAGGRSCWTHASKPLGSVEPRRASGSNDYASAAQHAADGASLSANDWPEQPPRRPTFRQANCCADDGTIGAPPTCLDSVHVVWSSSSMARRSASISARLSAVRTSRLDWQPRGSKHTLNQRINQFGYEASNDED